MPGLLTPGLHRSGLGMFAATAAYSSASRAEKLPFPQADSAVLDKWCCNPSTSGMVLEQLPRESRYVIASE